MNTWTMFFLFLAVLCWGLGGFLDKLMLKYLNATDAFFIRTFFMFVMFIPLIMWKLNPIKQTLKDSGATVLWIVVFGITFAMSGVFFYLKALSGAEASKIIPLSSSYPLITFLLAVVFLGEGFSLIKLTGTILVCAGIFLLSK